MKCKMCGKEFDGSSIKNSESYDRGDGVMYGTSVYSHNPICPQCGHDNTVKIFMTGRDNMEEKLGCWFDQVFIGCDECKYGNDVAGCSCFRKAFFAKLGHEKPSVCKINDTWM